MTSATTRLIVFMGVTGAAALGTGATLAQGTGSPWQACAALTHDSQARLACFDRWAQQQNPATLTSTAGPVTEHAAPAPVPVIGPPSAPHLAEAPRHDCADRRYSELSRFWELEPGSDCGTFGIRGYKPISLSWVGADNVNTQPGSPSAGHTAASALPYDVNEARIQLSVRTKIAQGLLTKGQPDRRDSLWFGYTQQSNWQLFNGDLSRPFRTTDHAPEITYIYPLDAPLPDGWRLRYGGLSVIHQSNGQSLPLSRSWNRTMLLIGAEKGNEFQLQGQLWNRLREDPADDDNPDISDYVGRAEIAGFWNINRNNTLGVTLRHTLRQNANGSLRLEWLRNLSATGVAGGRSGLRFHTQLFTGYGDALVDYNRQRTVLSVGLSLVDW